MRLQLLGLRSGIESHVFAATRATEISFDIYFQIPYGAFSDTYSATAPQPEIGVLLSG